MQDRRIKEIQQDLYMQFKWKSGY
uniref:Uncharacterized protein n=1 Tax=Rhizophora mucronata TaxID=61149 RepID=A0A2P2IUU0_RHIMU